MSERLLLHYCYLSADLYSVRFFYPFEKIAYKWTSARTMVYVNTIALFSFVTPLYFVVSLRDGSEKAFIQSDLLIHQDISRYDGFIYNVREQIHMEYLGTIWLIGVIGIFRLLCMEICQPVVCRKKVYVLCTG